MNKIIRTICLFRRHYRPADLKLLEPAAAALERAGYAIQTRRLCLATFDPAVDDREFQDDLLLGHGVLSWQTCLEHQAAFFNSVNRNLTLDLTPESIGLPHAQYLFDMMRTSPNNTFQFTYGFNIPVSSPFFPAARYGAEGFSVGLQPTDLAEGCSTLQQWLERMAAAWDEVHALLGGMEGYLGLDSSIAPLFEGDGSLVHLIGRIQGDFSRSVVSPVYTTISSFIKTRNPKPVGLCGLMFPCLEDFLLAEEYERGNFSIERNLFLSLHSGVGIDTYPIGLDEDPERVVDILRLLQALSNKYRKPLSARFVSDGKTKIGGRSDFRNQYLKDVVIRPL